MARAPEGYMPTPIKGVVRGLNGDERGRYFAQTPSGLSPISGKLTRAKIAAAARSDEFAEADDDETITMVEVVAKRSKFRASERSIPFNLSVEYLVDVCRAQRFRCALTGMTFRVRVHDNGTRNPFGPSIDRLDVFRGYEIGNVRLTTLIANIARADFGDSAFYEMCRQTAASPERIVTQNGTTA